MSFKFKETLTLTVPDVEEQLSAFSESSYTESHGLIIELAAIHEGMTANYNFYSAEALKNALESWVQPYPKPIILNHDTNEEPIGRVMAARMETEADGTPYTKLQVAVKDPAAIAKVMDQRYLTGSVGGKAEEALCSVCEADWAKASMFEAPPCKHSRGKTYKGKMAYFKLGELSFKEYSFVNVPADQRSTVRATVVDSAKESGADDDWVRPLHVFSLDMDNEKIVEFSEAEDRDVLAGMRNKESAPVYMQLKGAFLSTLAITESDKETDVADDLTNVEGDEDILAVTEGLSADLAAEEEGAEETPAEEPEAATEDVPEGDEGNNDPTEPEGDDDEEDTDKKVEDAAPEGQEKPSNEDELPVTRDSDEEPTTTPEDEPAAEEGSAELNANETDLNEEISTLESRVEELEAQNAQLLEQLASKDEIVSKLKGALKNSLAERVVDMKITLGLSEQSDREQLLEEHAKRSASSLADSLRDLASMPVPTREMVDAPPAMTELSGAVSDGGNVSTEGEDDAQIVELNPEDIFVDVLMGRTTI